LNASAPQGKEQEEREGFPRGKDSRKKSKKGTFKRGKRHRGSQYVGQEKEGHPNVCPGSSEEKHRNDPPHRVVRGSQGKSPREKVFPLWESNTWEEAKLCGTKREDPQKASEPTQKKPWHSGEKKIPGRIRGGGKKGDRSEKVRKNLHQEVVRLARKLKISLRSMGTSKHKPIEFRGLKKGKAWTSTKKAGTTRLKTRPPGVAWVKPKTLKSRGKLTIANEVCQGNS